MIACAVALLATAHAAVGGVDNASGRGSSPAATTEPAGQHDMLWSAEIPVEDIFSVELEAVGFGPGDSERGVGEDPTGVLVVVRSRTAGPHVELREGLTGELLWRRLPGGAAGESAFASPVSESECVVAAGSTLLFVNREGAVIGSARLPGLLRSAAGSGSLACVCAGSPETGFADSLVLFERGPGSGANSAQAVRVWSRALVDRNTRFDDGFSRPVFADTNGDGRDELLVVERMNEIVCRADTGNERWRVILGEKSRFKPIGVASADPVVADVTGDGIPDVAVGCFAGAVVVLDGELGDEIARLQFGTEAHEAHLRGRRLSSFIRDALASTGEPIGDMLAVELNGIGGAELVFGCSDGFVYAVSPRSGETLWRFRPGNDVYGRPVAEPGDARRLVVWDEECLYVLDAVTGAELATLPRSSIAAAAVLGWSDADVTVAMADGLAGRLEAWRVRAPRDVGDTRGASHATVPE